MREDIEEVLDVGGKPKKITPWKPTQSGGDWKLNPHSAPVGFEPGFQRLKAMQDILCQGSLALLTCQQSYGTHQSTYWFAGCKGRDLTTRICKENINKLKISTNNYYQK